MTTADETMDAFAAFDAMVLAAQAKLAKARKERAKTKAGMKHRAFPRPVASDALAVHPKQVAEAAKFAKDRGVPTEYRPDGSPMITSCAHQKALAKIHGFRPRRGY